MFTLGAKARAPFVPPRLAEIVSSPLLPQRGLVAALPSVASCSRALCFCFQPSNEACQGLRRDRARARRAWWSPECAVRLPACFAFAIVCTCPPCGRVQCDLRTACSRAKVDACALRSRRCTNGTPASEIATIPARPCALRSLATPHANGLPCTLHVRTHTCLNECIPVPPAGYAVFA